MKALVYTGPQALEYRTVADPDPRPGECLVAVEAVGICGSDMHAYHGRDERRPPPLILGHEACGRVVSGPRQGQRVVVNPLVTCGVCDDCLGGRSNLCARREIISMPPRQGAFAELLAMPESNLVAVPEGLDPTLAALAEPMATALHAVLLAGRASSRPLAEARALVLGGGAIGLSAALVLASRGCRRIALAETNPLRLAAARSSGVCEPYDPTAEAGPEGVDVVIDAVGGAATRAAACAAVRPGGVIVHVGLMSSDGGLDIRKITLQEVTLVGCYTYTMVDFRATVDGMARGAFGPLDWFERRSLADGVGAFADLDAGRVSASKVILTPDGVS